MDPSEEWTLIVVQLGELLGLIQQDIPKKQNKLKSISTQNKLIILSDIGCTQNFNKYVF